MAHTPTRNEENTVQRIFQQWQTAVPATVLVHLYRSLELYRHLPFGGRRNAPGTVRFAAAQIPHSFELLTHSQAGASSRPLRSDVADERIAPRIPEWEEARGYIESMALMVMGQADPGSSAAGSARRVLMTIGPPSAMDRGLDPEAA